MRGASLNVVGKGDLTKGGEIRPLFVEHIGAIFALYDAAGVQLATSERPEPLSKYAFCNGAQSVRHDYDGALARVQR
jgi:hypothetical protein